MEASRILCGAYHNLQLVHPCNQEHTIMIIKMTCSHRFNGASVSLVSRFSLVFTLGFCRFYCLNARGTEQELTTGQMVQSQLTMAG